MKNSKNKRQVAVIGAGFGGLAAAALLAKNGYDVTVYEKNYLPGGRANLLQKKGFRFDMGPSWLFMPDVFRELFANLGYDFDQEIKIHKLDPQYRIYYHDRSHLDLYGDLERDTAQFEKLEPGAGKQLKKYLSKAAAKYDAAVNGFLYDNADNLFDLIKPKPIIQLAPHSLFEPVHNHIARHFSETKLQKALEFAYVFLGCSPYNAPSLLSLLNHLDLGLGVYYPENGMHAVVKKMEMIGLKLGVKFKYGAPVTKINCDQHKVQSISVKNKDISTNLVISNADYTFTETLFSDQSLRNYDDAFWLRKTLGPSSFLIYLGVKGKYPQIPHHTLYLADDWQTHFDQIFKQPQLPFEPSIYINKPSATDKTVAPTGHEALMILVPIASGLHISKEENQKYQDFILSYIEEKLDIKFKSKIVFQESFAVQDFANLYHSYQGNAFGGIAHTLLQNSFMRPINYNKHLSNMYYVGAGTNPGVGVPPALISAKLVVKRILKNDQ